MQLSVAEAKAQFSEVLRRAAAGEVIEVTRYGKTIARIGPAEEASPLPRIGALAGQFTYDGPPDWTDEEIDEMLSSPLFPEEQAED